ncbi:MAG TPA: hypothetical protein VJ762_13035 [Sphingobium sp.]|nr:hypothetical protein [Sphingobium sp.]
MNDGLNVITLAWAVAALLFLLPLWPAAAAWRHRRHAAMAGIVLLGAATGYGMDVVNMPEIVGALVIGGAAGLLLGRELAPRHLPALMTMFAGLVALAMIAVAVAVALNPHAFGLTEEGSDRLTLASTLAIGLCVLTGAIACVGAGAALAGATSAPSRDIGATALMAATGGMTGWSIAAAAFLLENMGLAAAGGVVGAAGTVLALRLRGKAWRKGLAEPERRP